MKKGRQKRYPAGGNEPAGFFGVKDNKYDHMISNQMSDLLIYLAMAHTPALIPAITAISTTIHRTVAKAV